MQFTDDSRLNTDNITRSGGGGGLGGTGLKVGGGIGGVILMLLVGLFFGQDGVNVLNQVTGGTTLSTDNFNTGSNTSLSSECQTGADANKNVDCNMVATANSLDEFWGSYLLPETGVAYSKPKVNLFSGSVHTGCGNATSATGPFYCPVDRVVYVDTTFFKTIMTKLGATDGQAAEQYVLAHEYGHHIQNQLGNLKYSQSDPQGKNSGAVRVELQADCYAGIWTKNASGDMSGTVTVKAATSSDIQQIIDTTEAIGDDHIQMTSQGTTDSSTYTHGTSKQRTKWFMQGFNTGDLQQCDTFSSTNLDNPGA